MLALHEMRCAPCDAQTPLNKEATQKLLLQLHKTWELDATEPPCIKRCFGFKNFRQTMRFVNAVARIALQENHHPNLQASFNSCEVRFTTHHCQGLSKNDFICAAKVDRVFSTAAGRERVEAECTRYGIVVYVPAAQLESVKQAMFEAGAGCIGTYDRCAWQGSGQGQFRPLAGSQPFLGTQKVLETVEEVRIEMVCRSEVIDPVIAALSAAHPYEQPAYWVLRLENF